MHVIELARLHKGIVAAAGLHPWWVKPDSDGTYIRSMLDLSGVCAIMRCGLDEKIDTPIIIQKKLFILQLELGVETNLPVIVHSRKQFKQFMILFAIFLVYK